MTKNYQNTSNFEAFLKFSYENPLHSWGPILKRIRYLITRMGEAADHIQSNASTRPGPKIHQVTHNLNYRLCFIRFGVETNKFVGAWRNCQLSTSYLRVT